MAWHTVQNRCKNSLGTQSAAMHSTINSKETYANTAFDLAVFHILFIPIANT